MTLAERLAHITLAEQNAVKALSALELEFGEAACESDAVLAIERAFKAEYAEAWPANHTQAEVRWQGCVMHADWR